MSTWEKCLSNPHFVFILKISCTLELEVRDPDSGGREGWSWRPGGFGWLAAPWTQVDRSGQSPECPPLSARPLSPPQPPPPRSLCRPSVWNGPICGSGTLSGSRASQFVQTQNWFEDISHAGYCCKHAAKTLQFFALAGRVFELSKSLEVSSFPCKLSQILGKLGIYLR